MTTEEFTDEQWEAFQQTNKKCSRCLETFKVADFPSTSARGVLLIRSWCKKCLAGYYRDRKRNAKVPVAKVHVKLGESEFSAQGRAETVKEQMTAFLKIAASV